MNVLSKEEQIVADNVKRLMEDRDEPLSLRQLEELSGVSYRTIYGFISEGHSPRLSVVIKLAHALDVDLKDLLEKSPKRPRPKAVA